MFFIQTINEKIRFTMLRCVPEGNKLSFTSVLQPSAGVNTHEEAGAKLHCPKRL
jgi:hypothetical protein